jgi:hypothetical protein
METNKVISTPAIDALLQSTKRHESDLNQRIQMSANLSNQFDPSDKSYFSSSSSFPRITGEQSVCNNPTPPIPNLPLPFPSNSNLPFVNGIPSFDLSQFNFNRNLYNNHGQGDESSTTKSGISAQSLLQQQMQQYQQQQNFLQLQLQQQQHAQQQPLFNTQQLPFPIQMACYYQNLRNQLLAAGSEVRNQMMNSHSDSTSNPPSETSHPKMIHPFQLAAIQRQQLNAMVFPFLAQDSNVQFIDCNNSGPPLSDRKPYPSQSMGTDQNLSGTKRSLTAMDLMWDQITGQESHENQEEKKIKISDENEHHQTVDSNNHQQIGGSNCNSPRGMMEQIHKIDSKDNLMDFFENVHKSAPNTSTSISSPVATTYSVMAGPSTTTPVTRLPHSKSMDSLTKICSV